MLYTVCLKYPNWKLQDLKFIQLNNILFEKITFRIKHSPGMQYTYYFAGPFWACTLMYYFVFQRPAKYPIWRSADESKHYDVVVLVLVSRRTRGKLNLYSYTHLY